MTRPMSYQMYIDMQKEVYEQDVPSESIVGNYAFNEAIPYETHLLYLNGDVRYPILADMSDKIALDFACGPGRMIPRMSKYFARVDGVDISKRLIDEASAKHPASNFWVTNGDDLGGAPENTYDFVYSTIALQHIAVHSIRMKILEQIHGALKPGGFITLQFAFNRRFPMSKLVSETTDGKRVTVVYEEEMQHARWSEDRVDAKGSNSACDVGIGKADIPNLKSDFERHFHNVSYWFYDYSHFYRPPESLGLHHYWASHFLFVHGSK
jgi:SAM-dependent methyltransferase